MASGFLPDVIRRLRRAAEARGPGGLSDSQLLARFVRRRDEAAFELLVWRHGGLVWQTCRRVLRCPHDAEDAFQATFLALARQAGSVMRGEAVAGWLHRVAHRTALRARSAAERRARIERQAVSPEVTPESGWDDLRPVLDEEINRLPDKFRMPVILCYLQGKTNEEAAREIGCPRGTVLSRLARARERLRERLTRRGVTLTAGGFALALSSAAEASAPAALAGLTARAAALFAAGGTAAGFSAQALTLSEGVLHAMFLAKVKLVAAAVLAVGITGAGIGLYAQGPGAADRTAAAPDDKLKLPVPPDDDKDRARREDQTREQIVILQKEIAKAAAEMKALAAQRDQVMATMQALQVKLQQLEKQEQLAAREGRRPPQAEGWKELAALKGHLMSVRGVAFSPDGKRLASGGEDGLIFAWDVNSARILYQIRNHVTEGEVSAVAFSPDGTLLASATAADPRDVNNSTFVWWDALTGKQVGIRSHKDRFMDVAFAPDGRTLAAAGEDTIRLLDVLSGRDLRQMTHGKSLQAVAFSPDGKALASAGTDKTVRVWDVATGKELFLIKERNEFHAVAFSPDGRFLATGDSGGTVSLWDRTSGKEVRRIEAHRGEVFSVAFAPGGRSLASGGRDQTVRVWDVASGAEGRVGQHEGPVLAVAFSPDGKVLASAGGDKVVRLWVAGAARRETGDRPAVGGADRFQRLLKEMLDANKGDEQIVEALCLATLARFPTDGEKKSLLEHVAGKKDRSKAFADILWALRQSKEFREHVEALGKNDPTLPK